MDFEYIPKMNAKERFTYYIDCEEAFYNFVEEFNLIGVNWSQPTTFSSSYFFRLLQEGTSARAHGYGKKNNNKSDYVSDDMYGYYLPLLDHGALWKLFDGRVICTSLPYGDKKAIIDSFHQMVEDFGYPNTIKMEFLDEKYHFRLNGDYMIIIYYDDSEEKSNPDCSEEILRKKAIQHSKSIFDKHQINSSSYVRNRYVSEYAKMRAHGICQLCNRPAPFYDDSGKPFLETHHVVRLADGGKDSIKNTVALCPNCHRKMHILNLQEDINYLLQLVESLD